MEKRIRIKKDVFKNADFGKCYKTRCGCEAPTFILFVGGWSKKWNHKDNKLQNILTNICDLNYIHCGMILNPIFMEYKKK